jgi:polyhydroxyalkanoate synthesis regulator phasin
MELQRACDFYESQQRLLAQENGRLAETTLKLATAIDQLVKGASSPHETRSCVPNLILDLQRENSHLTDVLHRQQVTMECQTQQIRVFSERIADYQVIIAQKTNENIDNPQTPVSANAYKQRG